MKDIIQAIVIRSTGSWYKTRDDEGKIYDCRLKGKIRLQDLKSTNPVAVGDRVEIQLGRENDSHSILGVLPRKNYLLRKSVKLSSQVHILCSNIDQLIIMACLTHPFTPLGYIDRALVSAEAYHIPALIVFNKLDLIQQEGMEKKLNDYLTVYAAIGYPCLSFIASDPNYKAKAIDLLKNKTSFVIGHSGSGKSSFINLAEPDLKLKTGAISNYSEKGKHTTTFAEMFPLSFGGYIIDSPGFKEMTLTGFERNEVSHYFPEMRKLLVNCKFKNCLHLSEPGCAVLEALDKESIAESRYHTYLGMLEESEA